MFTFANQGMRHYYTRDPDSLSRLLTFMEKHVEKSIVLSIARVAHEVNRAFCQSIGDHSQPAWEDAPNWQRSSACNGVEAHLKDPTLTPAQSHELWMEQKLREGWVFGEVKDPNAKTHPCMVPYEQLPQEQRSKDFLFRGVVHAIAREMARPA
jgi:hypothetical protein